MTIVTSSAEETEQLGERLAGALAPGCVVGLIGPLGAGKTTLVRGLARGLGIDDGVHSPTFVTVAEYEGRLLLRHVDLYRHDTVLPDRDWLAEILDAQEAAIVVVEWFDRLGRERPADALWIEIEYDAALPDRRCLRVQATGPQASAAIDRFSHPATGRGGIVTADATRGAVP